MGPPARDVADVNATSSRAGRFGYQTPRLPEDRERAAARERVHAALNALASYPPEILVFSGYSREQMAERTRALGAAAYLQKGGRRAEIGEVVRTLAASLRRSR